MQTNYHVKGVIYLWGLCLKTKQAGFNLDVKLSFISLTQFCPISDCKLSWLCLPPLGCLNAAKNPRQGVSNAISGGHLEIHPRHSKTHA